MAFMSRFMLGGSALSELKRGRSNPPKLPKPARVTRLDFSGFSPPRRGYCSCGLYFGRCRISHLNVVVSNVRLDDSLGVHRAILIRIGMLFL